MSKTRRNIPGYEKIYEIDMCGNVYSVPRNGTTCNYKIKKPFIKKEGYVSIVLNNKGKKHFYIHRLVAQVFIPNPKNRPCVNHKNGIKTDNCVENLEWCTYSENHKHAYKINLMKKGEKHHGSKLTKKQVLEIRKKYKLYKNTQKILANKYGVSGSTISEIINRKIWKHV